MNAASDAGVGTGVLVAGGEARRAGLDKRYLVLEGRTLLVRNLAFLRSRFPEVAVVIGRGQDIDLGDAGDPEVLRDAWPGASPLIGIATALARFRRPLFALAADIAFPQRGAAEAVLAAFPGHDAALPVIGERFRQPLFAAYGPACLAPMADLIASGRHRIVDIFDRVAVARVPFADDSPFRNVNTIDDYREARARATGGPWGDRAAGELRPAVVTITGWTGAGKTGLIERLVPELERLGLRVDTELKDTLSLSSGHRGSATPLTGTVPCRAGRPDLVVAEGGARTSPFLVEVFRGGRGHAGPLHGPGETLALVTDADVDHPRRFSPDDAPGLARFLAVRLDTLRSY